MSKLVWDATGARKFEAGVDHGVLYVQKADGTYDTGVAWNGLTSFSASPDGAEPTDLWADNIKYATLRSTETFGGTIEAYTYPLEFMQCDGSAEALTGVYIGQQGRKAFGFCYRTMTGSDTDPSLTEDNTNYNYKIHVVYNCTASPSERQYETINDSPDAITFSWEITTTPVNITGYKPVSEITIDMATLASAKRATVINTLYGTDASGGTAATDPTLPSPDALLALLT